LASAVARISSAWRRPLARRDRRAARSQHPAPATEPRRWRNQRPRAQAGTPPGGSSADDRL